MLIFISGPHPYVDYAVFCSGLAASTTSTNHFPVSTPRHNSTLRLCQSPQKCCNGPKHIDGDGKYTHPSKHNKAGNNWPASKNRQNNALNGKW